MKARVVSLSSARRVSRTRREAAVSRFEAWQKSIRVLNVRWSASDRGHRRAR
jgi:hypothetical protein